MSGWILNRGLRIVMLLIAAVLAARFVTWLANRVTRRLDLGCRKRRVGALGGNPSTASRSVR